MVSVPPTSDEPVVLKLKAPIKLGDETISELRLRRPFGEEMWKVPVNAAAWTFGDLLELGGVLADVPPSTMKKLGTYDVLEVVSIVSGFIGSGRTTGD